MEAVTEDLLAEVTRKLVEALHPLKIILFGSHAYGKPNRHSDLDIMIVVPHGEKSEYELAVEAYGATSDIPISKDIIVRHIDRYMDRLDLYCSLERVAETKGRLLYAA